MKPTIEDYKILSFSGKYYVLTPYDLHAMPALRIVGPAFDTRQEAASHSIKVFESDTSEFNRLLAMGRSFPDND